MRISSATFAFVTAAAAPLLFLGAVPSARAAFKLPYPAGTSFIVAQGYHAPPTHIKKDDYALDFTGNGCAAYGTPAAAAAPGKVTLILQKGYNGGYGTEALVTSGDGLVERYAHMLPGSIAVAAGMAVTQGEVIGKIGDTGLVAGGACAAHPGTHLHFAVYRPVPGGTFAAYDPEPVSGYTGIVAGRWYLSDNGEPSAGAVLGAATGTAVAVATATASTTFDAPTSSAAAASSTADNADGDCVDDGIE